jgi:AcrR family transcriptional regulator
MKRTEKKVSSNKAKNKRRTIGRGAKVNAAVFKAAIGLLKERSFLDISIGEIASRSGVHETTLYRRWECKENIFVEAIYAYYMKEVIPIPDTGSLRSDLIQWMLEAIDFYKSPLGLSFIQMSGYIVQKQDGKYTFQNYWRNRLRWLVRLLNGRNKGVRSYR